MCLWGLDSGRSVGDLNVDTSVGDIDGSVGGF